MRLRRRNHLMQPCASRVAVSPGPLSMPYVHGGHCRRGQTLQAGVRLTPAGVQPEAIRQLIEGVAGGERDQALLGVTGSGKAFTMASISSTPEPAGAGAGANKTLAAQPGRVRGFFPGTRSNTSSPATTHQPEARAAHRPTSEGFLINEQIDRMRQLALGARLMANVASVSASGSGPAGELRGDDLPPAQGRGRPPPCCVVGNNTTQRQRPALPKLRLLMTFPALRGQGLALRCSATVRDTGFDP